MTLERETSVRHNVDLSLITSVTNPAEVAKLLSDVYNEERVVDGELRNLISRRDTFEDLLNTAIQESNEVLEVVNADAEQLLRGVMNASSVAEDISSTVKTLDKIQSNVKSALSHISIIVDRSTCVHRLRESMDREDYQTATDCVAQFHALQKEIKEQPEHHQKQAVEELETLLLQVIRQKVKEGVQTDNGPQIIQFIKLLIPLGHQKEGLDSYSMYLKSVVSGKGRVEYQSLSEDLESRSSKAADFTKHLSDLFRAVAVLIEQHQNILIESFGDEASFELVQSLQTECEEHAVRILKRFHEARRITQIIQEINLRRNKQLSGVPAQSPDAVDPRTIENALVDILNLVRRCSEFGLFFEKRLGMISTTSKSSTRVSRLHDSGLDFQVKELTGAYVNLEEFYLEENVKKAIEIDKLLSGSLVSSMVDDVFFVFRKSALRAISSRSVPSACAILSLINTLLSQNYMSYLQQKLSPGPGMFIQSLITEDEEGTVVQKEQMSSDFGTFWNDVQMSVVYISKIREELEQRIEANFTNSKERETVSSILADLSKTALDLEKILESGKTRLCEILLTKLISNFQEITKCEYQLDEQSYEQLSVMESWPHHITAKIEQFSNQLTSRLTPENHSQVMDALMTALVHRFEAQLMQKRFNQLGGLQLDRDVRLLVTRLSEMSQSAVREKFSRLTQMGTILCFESVEEMLDYWGDEGGSINWKLSPGEIKAILRLRTDFSEANIAALLL